MNVDELTKAGLVMAALTAGILPARCGDGEYYPFASTGKQHSAIRDLRVVTFYWDTPEGALVAAAQALNFSPIHLVETGMVMVPMGRLNEVCHRLFDEPFRYMIGGGLLREDIVDVIAGDLAAALSGTYTHPAKTETEDAPHGE